MGQKAACPQFLEAGELRHQVILDLRLRGRFWILDWGETTDESISLEASF
jgi:hypothetical protein